MANKTTPCFIPGCENLSASKKPGPCTGHTMRLKQRGSYDAHIPLRTSSVKPKPKSCIVDGCDLTSRTAAQQGPCDSHYRRWRTHGDYQVDKPLKKRIEHGDTFPDCVVDDCPKPSRTMIPGPCTIHYRRMNQTGSYQVDKPIGAAPTPPDVIATWVAQLLVESHSGCVTWPFGRMPRGYGSWENNDAPFVTNLAHRAICWMAHGDAPKKQPVVRHLCGNGHLGCVAPDHLRWGTGIDNSIDSLVHRTHSTMKLSPEKVRYIRQSPASDSDLARLFGLVKPESISKARHGVTWAWIDPVGPVWSPKAA